MRRTSDEEIQRGIDQDPDAYPLPDKFWQKARLVSPKDKTFVTLFIEEEVLDWFRRHGDCEEAVNKALRGYMERHGRNDSPPSP